jgi:CBS domain-containing protein
MRITPVSELMTREVKFIKESVSLLDAVRKMKEFQVSSLVVESDSEADWFGIVTQKDIINKLMDPEPGKEYAIVGDVMTRPAITVPPIMSVLSCVKLMKRLNIRRLPVCAGRDIVGILSNTDIFRKFYLGPSVD